MQLFRSLFCLFGKDNRLRFSTIVAASHLFFILFSSLFKSSFILSLCVLTLSSVVFICTSKRRLTDAQLNLNWLIAPGAVFFLIGLIIIGISNSEAYWLTIIPFSISLILLTYPGKNKQAYVYGYSGPIDLTTDSPNKTTRIEPTFSGESRVHGASEQYQNYDNSTKFNDSLEDDIQENTSTDVGVVIREKILGDRNASKALLIVFLIVIFIISATIISDSTDRVDNVNTEDNITSVKHIDSIKRDNKLTFLDEFSLLSTPYNGLVIHWEADINSSSEIWNISTAEGDNSCSQITFNNGTTYRTTIVSVEGTDNYYASFSPLDSQQLLKNIAARSTFELCGYEFSLKGSQASIGKHPFYSELLN